MFIIMESSSLIRLSFFTQSPSFHLWILVELEIVIRGDDIV